MTNGFGCRGLSLLAVLVIGLGMNGAGVAADAVPAGEQVAQLRTMARDGLRDAVANEKAFEALRAAVQRWPDSPLLRAYLGTSETVRGRDAWLPWHKLAYVHDGIDHLQQALGAVAGDDSDALAAETRLVAGNAFLALPGRFDTRERGQALARRLLADGALQSWPAPLQARVCLLAVRADGDTLTPSRQHALLEQARALADGEAELVRRVDALLGQLGRGEPLAWGPDGDGP